jgi:hypothetical protein
MSGQIGKEKIYSCEVKKLFVRDGERVWEWVIAEVADAIRDEATQFRCKDCFGAVRLHGKHVENGPAPHVEHKSRQDSEYCPAGMYFRRHPGRVPKLSSMPVK